MRLVSEARPEHAFPRSSQNDFDNEVLESRPTNHYRRVDGGQDQVRRRRNRRRDSTRTEFDTSAAEALADFNQIEAQAFSDYDQKVQTAATENGQPSPSTENLNRSILPPANSFLGDEPIQLAQAPAAPSKSVQPRNERKTRLHPDVQAAWERHQKLVADELRKRENTPFAQKVITLYPVQTRNGEIVADIHFPFLRGTPAKKSEQIELDTFVPERLDTDRPTYRSTTGKVHFARQGHHVSIPMENMEKGDLVGSAGAGPCIGVIVITTGDDATIHCFHFQGGDWPVSTLSGKRFPKDSRCIVFGGDNTDESNLLLKRVLRGLPSKPEQVNRSGLWVRQDGTILYFSGDLENEK